jgi:hypothetical protein
MKHPAPTHVVSEMFARSPERRLALLRAVWPGAVGADLARRSAIVAFDNGILRVQVPDGAWRKVLFRMRGEILARLRRTTGPAAPRALGFVEGAVPEPDPALSVVPAAVRREVPSTVREAAAAIVDPALRARFVEAATTYLTRFGPPEDAAGPDEGGSSL